MRYRLALQLITQQPVRYLKLLNGTRNSVFPQRVGAEVLSHSILMGAEVFGHCADPALFGLGLLLSIRGGSILSSRQRFSCSATGPLLRTGCLCRYI